MLKPAAKNALVAAWVAAAEVGAAPLQDVIAQTGHIHALTIFAHFADERGLGREVPSFAAGIFAEQPGSLTHFYREMSRGQFTLTGEVLPRWYAAHSNADVYAESGFGRFAREVIRGRRCRCGFWPLRQRRPRRNAQLRRRRWIRGFYFYRLGLGPDGFYNRRSHGRRPAWVVRRLCEPRPRPTRRLHPDPTRKAVPCSAGGLLSRL